MSNICNLQCHFCPEVQRSQFKISLSALRKRLVQVQPLAERVCYHVMGEPLGHPDFPSLVEVAGELLVPLEITTNGTLLNASSTQALLHPTVVQVNFSLQSFVDNFPKANPDSYLQKIFAFCHRAFQERPDLYLNLRLWNLEPSRQHQSVNESFLKSIGQEFSVQLNSQVDPSFKKSKRVRNRLYVHFDSRFEWPSLSRPFLSAKGTCHGLKSQLAILSEGDVVPCCLDKEAVVSLGNVEHQDLEEILNSPRSRSILEGFQKGELREELCQSCSYAQRFYKAATL